MEKLPSETNLRDQIVEALHDSHQTNQFLMKIWGEYDVNGNGTLSKQEVKHFCDYYLRKLYGLDYGQDLFEHE